MISYELIDNEPLKRYELKLEGARPFVEYIRTKDKIYLTHTEVPSALEGNGLGTLLIEKVILEIDRNGLTLIPLCPFVALYLKNNPEWKRLVLKGINVN